METIPFSKTVHFDSTYEMIKEVINSGKLSGDHSFTKITSAWFEEETKCEKILLTSSCTHALELSAILINIQKGDEVILPSYTFSSTANAFALRGAKLIFVDIRPDTMNINEKLIESAITSKTKP